MATVEFSERTNLIEQAVYKPCLQDVAEPNLYREIMPYKEIPKVTFNHRHVPMVVPDEIWITDTTFRDGQQSPGKDLVLLHPEDYIYIQPVL